MSNEDMLNNIRDFLSTMHDYNPMGVLNSPKIKVVGCFNSAYHNDMGRAIVISPKQYFGDNKERPIYVFGYELFSDGKVIVITDDMISVNIKRCGEGSIKAVYNALMDVKKNNEKYEKLEDRDINGGGY